MERKVIVGVVAGLVLVGAGTAAGIEYRPYEATQYSTQAQTLLRAGQYRAALSAATQAAAFGAADAAPLERAAQADIYLSLARSALSSNQYTVAMTDAAKAASYGQSQAAAGLEQRAQALQTAAQHYQLGVQALQQQQWATAAAELRQVIQGSPDYSQAQQRLAYIQTTLTSDVQTDISSSRYHTALAEVTLLLQLFSSDSTAQGLKAQVESGLVSADIQAGDSQLGAGNYYAAENDFNNALTINPSDGVAMLNMGLAYYRSGDPTSSITYFQNAAQLLSQAGDYTNESIADYDLGLAYYNTGHYVHAATAFQDAVNANPSDTSAQNYLSALQNAGY